MESELEERIKKATDIEKEVKADRKKRTIARNEDSLITFD